MPNRRDEKRLVYIDILRIVGICLIINSHLDSIYPIPQLATGGALGNTLFFICAGFCFQTKNKNFTAWYFKKIIKIYIPVYLVTSVSPLAFTDLFITRYIWPTDYWFVGAMALFYIFLYIAERYDFIQYFSITFIVLIVLYILYYIFLLDTSNYVVEASGLLTIEGKFKLIYYFAIMFTGRYIRKFKMEKIRGEKRYLFGAILAVFVFYIVKLLGSKYLIFLHLQFLEQVFAFIFAVLLLSYGIKTKWLNSLKSEKVVLVIEKISSMSLCIYLIQFCVIRFCSIYFKFPVSLIAVLAFTFVCSGILQKISKGIENGIYFCVAAMKVKRNKV